MWPNSVRLFAVLICLLLPCLVAQTFDVTGRFVSITKSKSQFFAGVVTSLSPGLVVVSRTIPGRKPEHRTFLITPRTKIFRSLKVKQRVTVRFQRQIEGDVAVEIQVRPKKARPASVSTSWFLSEDIA